MEWNDGETGRDSFILPLGPFATGSWPCTHLLLPHAAASASLLSACGMERQVPSPEKRQAW